ncbi:lipase family protein [Micromonospora sp. CPCC 206061]|uniref:lipase family protein n=1 Tax=Micromonospora sp. CPCC 206061 TaxID=3122410 RepID=UPI002FF200ED
MWGHSQGGHAVLWTGIAAPAYAPDAHVVGVAAFAPASDLPALAARLETLRGGTVLSSFVIQAYAEAYRDVTFNHYVRPAARIQIREMASRCLNEPELFVSVLESTIFTESVLARSPTRGGLGQRLAENTPTGPIPVPVLIGQGEADGLILPAVQASYVRKTLRRWRPARLPRVPRPGPPQYTGFLDESQARRMAQALREAAPASKDRWRNITDAVRTSNDRNPPSPPTQP